jgi:hypothetical protein
MLVMLLAAALFTGCTYYQTPPGTYVTTTTAPASSFDRSYAAAIGALKDQGVGITTEDRSSGFVRGTRNGINVTANVQTRTDGSVRVEFNTSGSTAKDPELINRITQSYNRRMGRKPVPNSPKSHQQGTVYL